MANLSITVTNTLDVHGPAAATVWNTFLWGAANWGQSADLGTQVEHVVDTTLSPTSEPMKLVTKFVDDEGVFLASELEKIFYMLVNNSITLLADMQSERLQESNGYFYLYPDRTTDAESRAVNTYTAGTGPGSSWTPVAAAATSWS
jgi:hypothetical protein